MRVVIFDEETLEPVTVVNLPGLTDRCLEERKYWRVALPQTGPRHDDDGARGYGESIRYVDLEFERFARLTLTHGVLSFAFNLVVLAIAVNVFAGSLA